MAAVFIRILMIYLVLILSMRLSGKRQIGEMQVSELVTTFLLSELASVPLTNPGIPLLHALVPIFTIISVEIILSFLTTKWSIAKKLLDGKPSIVVRRGKLQKKEMERMRLSLDDLLCELRLKNISSLDEVEYALLEPNGKISVFSKSQAPLSHTVIIDGILQSEGLSAAGKNKKWLEELMKKKKISDIRQIFLLSVTDDNKILLVEKDGNE